MKKLMLILLSVSLILSNCQYVGKDIIYTNTYPVLPELFRPELKPVPLEIINKLDGNSLMYFKERDKTLKEHIEKLEIIIKNYNEYAKKQNKK